MNLLESETRELPLGHTIPRVFTPPLVDEDSGPCDCLDFVAENGVIEFPRATEACICRCECGCGLTPETSLGFNVIDFACNILRFPPDKWQRWLLIHAMELQPNGKPRFRKVLVLVARQNGKTQLLVILSLYWLFVQQVAVVLGVSSKVEYAKEAWAKAKDMAQQNRYLGPRIPKKGGVRLENGSVTLLAKHPLYDDDGEPLLINGDPVYQDSRYKIAAANDDAGRSLTIDRLIMDEFRRQYDWNAYNAAIPTQNAVWDAQAWLLSNQGDYRSEPLHSLQDSAHEFIKTGIGDPQLGIFEWSCPEGSDPEDPNALAMANPNVGHRIDWPTLLGEAARVKIKGGKELAGFKIEIMCMRVAQTDPAIDPVGWRECAAGQSVAELIRQNRNTLVYCFDVSIDEQHATLYAAVRVPVPITEVLAAENRPQQPSDTLESSYKIAVDVVRSWEGPNCADQLGAQLPGLVRKHKPVAVVFFPGGPAASVAAAMEKRRRRADEAPWPPRGVSIEEVRGDAPAACMGFASLVNGRRLLHGADVEDQDWATNDLLSKHALSADKLPVGDAWRFTRRDAAHCDGAYAAAGAAHKARSVEPRREFVVPSSRGSDGQNSPIEKEDG